MNVFNSLILKDFKSFIVDSFVAASEHDIKLG